MANQILVKTPLTTNGTDPVFGEDGKRVFTESILGISAKSVLEKRNTTLPQHLKVEISDYDGPVGILADTDKVDTKKTANNAKA